MRVSETTSHWFSRVVLPLLVGVVCAAFSRQLVSTSDSLNVIEASRFRANSSRLPSVSESRILLIGVTDQTRKRLSLDDGPDPLPRDVYARLLEGLDQANTKVALVDIRFETSKPAPDAILKRALSHLKHLKVTLITGYTDNADFTETDHGTLGPYEPSAIYDAATMPRVRLGGGQAMVDKAGKLSGAYFEENGTAGEKRLHATFQAALQFLDVEDRPYHFDTTTDILSVGALTWQLEPSERLRIEWTKTQNGIATRELSDVLAQLKRPSAKKEFAGKIVVIGDFRGDQFDSEPFGSVPGSLFIANQLNTVLKPQSARLRQLEPSLYWTLNSALAVAAFTIAFSRRAVLSIAGTVGLVVVAWYLPVLLARWLGTLTDTLVPILAILEAGTLGLIATQSGLYREDHRMPGAAEDATVMFLDLRGSTELLNRVGADAYRRTVEDLLSSCTTVVRKNGGTVERTLGDGFLAIFRPRPGRHHALRCADAVFPLLRTARAVSERHQIEFHIGLGFESGYVTGGYVSEGKRRVWSSAGVTVNLAQRLVSAANALETSVLVGPNARGFVEFEYETISLGQIRVKGFETMPEAATFKKAKPES